MTTNESRGAYDTAALDYRTRLAPIGSAGTRHVTSAAAVTQRAAYLRTLAHVLKRTRFHGSTIQGALYYSVVGDPTGRRLHLTTPGLRIIYPNETPHTRERLRLNLIHHGAQLLCEIDDLTVNAHLFGITDGRTLRREIDALITDYTIARIRNSLQDADDAEQHLPTLLCPRRAQQVHVATQRHPAAGPRPTMAGGPR